MDFLIIKKWLTDYSNREYQAPSIISQMINNFIKGGEIVGSELIDN
jgi:hypothetical protein